jgi:hypothetical protein
MDEVKWRSVLVIASQRVGAQRRPMTGSVKQSIAPQADRWIASSQEFLAMTKFTDHPAHPSSIAKSPH